MQDFATTETFTSIFLLAIYYTDVLPVMVSSRLLTGEHTRLFFMFVGVELSIQKFLDIAKQLECCFLQKRLVLSIHKPEQIIKEVSAAYWECLKRSKTCSNQDYRGIHRITTVSNRHAILSERFNKI